VIMEVRVWNDGVTELVIDWVQKGIGYSIMLGSCKGV